MEEFAYRGDALCVGAMPLEDLALRFGTPCYVYSADAMTRRLRELQAACAGLAHRIHYAVKANSNLAVLQHMARHGCGFDVVSGGELARVRAAGGAAAAVVFSGVGKRESEIRAALEAGVGALHIESRAEAQRVAQAARALRVVAPVCLRVNPEIAVRTHPHIATALRDSKFGVPAGDARALCRELAGDAHLRLRGLACHIGSQLLDLAPLLAAARQMTELMEQVAADGAALDTLDLGGGLGIRYGKEEAPSMAAYAEGLRALLDGRGWTLVLEPGRWLVGAAGALLTTVEYRKRSDAKNFLVVDAAMTELLRPALYDAWHDIVPVRRGAAAAPERCDVVGPVCESGDALGRDRRLAARAGDVLAVLSAGAYASSFGITYNSRPRAAEVLVHGDRAQLVRERESEEQLYANERLWETG